MSFGDFEIIIYCPTENVSKDKPAAQTETKAGNEAKFAVDGVIDQKSNYSHAITKVDNSTVWWEVELGGVQKIHVIRVYFAEPGITVKFLLKYRKDPKSSDRHV